MISGSTLMTVNSFTKIIRKNEMNFRSTKKRLSDNFFSWEFFRNEGLFRKNPRKFQTEKISPALPIEKKK